MSFRSYLFAAACLTPVMATSQVQVLTHRYNNARTGFNNNEKILNRTNVRVATFGKLFSRNLDARSYCQPLIATNVSIPGKGERNVVYVETIHNSVYAFDADGRQATPYWQVNLGSTVLLSELGKANIYPEMGIVGTPVIKRSANTIYMASYTHDDAGAIIYKLHALDLGTGQDKPNSPVVIQGNVSGSAVDGDGTHLTFNPRQHLQRPALTLFNNRVLICFGSHADLQPFHGWIFSYNADTLAKCGIYCTTPSALGGSIWQAGAGLASDGTYIYCCSGNGSYTSGTGTSSGNSIIKLSIGANSISRVDWFTPFNSQWMNTYDLDFGSSGPMCLPGTSLILQGGKSTVLYVVDSHVLGKFHAGSDPDIVQSWSVGLGHIHGTPALYDGPNGRYIYIWSEEDRIRQYHWLGGSFDPVPTSVGNYMLEDGRMPGGFITVSSKGTAANTGIVWAIRPDWVHEIGDTPPPAILHAFSADDLSQELWNSTQNAARDAIGRYAKYVPPVVANGKVYIMDFDNKLLVYGLLN